ncbi:MAG: hypothetical protein JSV16_10090, partial [Candidatus Hydrogenedentota bacterium]
VVLDSIAPTRTADGAMTYYGFIDSEQLEWLRKDLAQIGRSKPVILVSHIPTINALASAVGLETEFVSTPTGEKRLKHQVGNFQQILGEILKGYNFRLALAGHYHTYEEVRWKDNEHDALFVVGGSICGDWWRGDRIVGYSSWPEGFTLIKVDGEKFNVSYIPYGWEGVEEQ